MATTSSIKLAEPTELYGRLYSLRGDINIVRSTGSKQVKPPVPGAGNPGVDRLNRWYFTGRVRPIRVVLADDHWLMRDETHRILEQCPDMVVAGEAEDGEQAIGLAGHLQPDVLLLDIRMPQVDGIEVLKRLREHSPNTRVLILSAYDDDDYVMAAMAAGATGYLLKTARAEELTDAIRRVHRGEPVLHAAIAAKVARLWAGKREPSEPEFSEPLSPREREVMQLAAKGLRNKAIAAKLNVAHRTVEGHFNSIFNKLGVSSRLEAVVYALSHGIVALDEEANK